MDNLSSEEPFDPLTHVVDDNKRENDATEDEISEIYSNLKIDDNKLSDIGIDNALKVELDNEIDEFPGTMIDRDELMESSEDQDILASPNSSFSFDDTLSDQEVDGLTNYNIILEYPQLTFENIQLLPFHDELNDWFTSKDISHLDSVLKLSKNVTINDLDNIKQNIEHGMKNNTNILVYVLKLAYISMGCFENAKSEYELKQTIFQNILAIIHNDDLLDSLFKIVISNITKLTDVSLLCNNMSVKKLDAISYEFFYCSTIIYIIILSFNTEELNHYDEKQTVMDYINKHNILIEILKSIDKWKLISNTSEKRDTSVVLESLTSKSTDNEKFILLAVTHFRIKNVISLLNNLIIFQFGDLQHIRSTKDFLKFKFETSNCSKIKMSNNTTNDGEGAKHESIDPEKYSISSLDYQYYVNELTSRYPTYIPPKYEVSEILEMTVNNNNNNSPPVSNLLNVESLLINQHQNLKGNLFKQSTFNNEIPEIHIATPMPSPTLTPQHTGNTRNYSNITELEHTSNEIKKKLYITQSNFPNIYPSSEEVPKSIQDATNIFFHHIKDDYKTKQFTNIFEEFVDIENGVKDSDKIHKSNYVYTENDIKENPMFVDEIKSLQNVERFYREGIPYFKSLIAVILKLLVSNIIPSQKSSENGKTRQRTAKDTNDAEKKPYLSEKLTSYEKQKLEIKKSKELMLKNGTSIILLIQKWLKLSNILKFEYFTTLLFDQDYLIYLFRYLDSNKIQAYASKDVDLPESKGLLNNRVVYCDYNVLYYLKEYNFFKKAISLSQNVSKVVDPIDEMKDFAEIFDNGAEYDESEDDSSRDGNKNKGELVNPLSVILPYVPHNKIFKITKPNTRCCILLSNLLQSMYYTVSHFKIQRIYKLIGIRPTEILRFYLTLHNNLFYIPILKTIKLMSPFIGKKWRANNMDLISFVYLFHKVGLKDPWLNNFFNAGIEENAKRGYDNEVSLRSLIKFYNFTYYGDVLKARGFEQEGDQFMEEVEKLSGDIFTKGCVESD